MGGGAGSTAEVASGVAGVVVGVGASRCTDGTNLVDGIGDLIAGAVVVECGGKQRAVAGFVNVYGIPILFVAFVKDMP